MFEPGMMGSIGWKSEQSSPRINGNSRLIPPTQSVNPAVGTGVDSVTWAVPISPNYNNFNSNTMPTSSRPIGFTRSEDQIPRSHLGLNSPVIDYTTNVNPSNGVTYNSYHQNTQSSQSNNVQSGVNRYTKNNNTRTNNRRSYDYSNPKDNTTTDFFTQGYRHVLGKMPNSIKNHLIKPANRVDFDLLQGN
ncbi:hypothetical protein CONCODRAFT_129990 [Conidiobolus coronatus NRRL 28638]|uniref:Uncharacterized protein n=1 Tax=Conidiobolus coronatus (strain ATCC 28846 / CBS 209.66 / NRRL 28638) TaxID=796925 RepID=A0A137NU68_CONC2|nr:hypothetical protein CONCODRAFT_129990 [Conidiobolus coronatus NRRL 28638]|eukprot:KXN66286.1 hypothetical protein CONCODRAFT_129990 [Conidiobolus coronatus NRRL 28638]